MNNPSHRPRLRTLAASVFTLAAAWAPALAVAAPALPAKVRSVEGITEYRLANGLQVLLFPDQSKATVTVNITCFVGSRHEGYGESGMAHLLEHMVFKGTPRRADIWKLLQDHGANFNGTTWYDRTNYYEELPATPENLDFALGLEADRLVNSKIAAGDLAKEFSVVRNEFESGENNPQRVLEEKMFSVAYQWHNYGKTTIGSKVDIERVPAGNLRAFYKKFYQPDNAMLVVAGKFDEARALGLIANYFGSIPRPARVLPKTWTLEPVQDGERIVTLRRTGDVALVGLLYHGAAGADRDWVVEDAVIDMLTNKPAGRLYKALVEKGLASEVYGYTYPLAEPGALLFGAKVQAGGSPEKVRDIMAAIVESVAAGKIGEDEVQRWKTRTLKEFELVLTETANVGVALSDWAAMGDWRLFFLTRDRAKDVSSTDVARVAGAFLKRSNRTVGLFLPTKEKDLDRATAASLPDVAAMMKDYKGGSAGTEGENFTATIENVEKRTTRVQLPNGMKLALLPKKTKGGSVKMVLTLRYGSQADLRGKVPAADMITDMLMRGTKKRSFQQVKDEMDRLKMEISSSQGRLSVSAAGMASLRIKTVRPSLPAVIALLSEILREPAFPKSEFGRLQKESLTRLEEQVQDPATNGFTTISQRLFPWPKDDVRYVPSIKENIDRTKQAKITDVAALHKNLWGAGSSQLAIVGDFEPDATRALVEKELGSWKALRPFQRIERPFKPSPVMEDIINTPDKQMAFVGVGQAIEVRDDDPDYPALVMVNYILGGSANSRLLDRLRQKDGLSYGAFSGLNAFPLDRSGYFFAGAICAPGNADKAGKAMQEEIDRLLKDGAGEKEIADAKKSYAQSWDGRMAEDDFVAGELANQAYLDRTFSYWKQVNDRIQKLAAADVTAAARKYINSARLARVKAGDLAKKN